MCLDYTSVYTHSIGRSPLLQCYTAMSCSLYLYTAGLHKNYIGLYMLWTDVRNVCSTYISVAAWMMKIPDILVYEFLYSNDLNTKNKKLNMRLEYSNVTLRISSYLFIDLRLSTDSHWTGTSIDITLNMNLTSQNIIQYTDVPIVNLCWALYIYIYYLPGNVIPAVVGLVYINLQPEYELPSSTRSNWKRQIFIQYSIWWQNFTTFTCTTLWIFCWLFED